MDRLLQQAEKIAKTDKSVLLLGETGVGKGVLAKTIHHHSPRRQQEFIKVNCAGMSLGLIGSELFGHEKGAFTSAFARHRGHFEQAHGGTLFLDEIAALRKANWIVAGPRGPRTCWA